MSDLNAAPESGNDLPARAVIIATKTLEGALGHAEEACRRVGAMAIPWDGRSPAPGRPVGIPPGGLVVLAALDAGERRIPEHLLRLCRRDWLGASLLLLSCESLVRPTVSLQSGRVTLIEPPFTVRRIASRLRLILAPIGGERGEELPDPPAGAASSVRQTVHQHQQAAYWLGTLGQPGAEPGPGSQPPTLLEDGQGVTVLIPTGNADQAPADLEQRCADAAALVRAGGSTETTAARLAALVGAGAGMLSLGARGDDWLVYWPGIAIRLWLFSTRRLPTWWDLGRGAAELPGACLRLPATSGDVVMILPPGPWDWAGEAARPGFAGRVPADLAEAAIDGAPALLESIAARSQGAGAAPSYALTLEVR